MNPTFWQEELETMPRPALERLQLERLQESLRRAATSPFYSRLFRERNIRPEDIRSLADVRKLPFTV